MSILRTTFFGAVLSGLCLSSLSTVLCANLIPNIEDYQRRIPPIENSQRTFPQNRFDSSSPDQMNVIQAPRWAEHFSPLGTRMHGVQPETSRVSPNVQNFEVRNFPQRNFQQWAGQDQKYFHRNLDKQTEMTLVKKYAESPRADLSFGAGLPYEMKDVLETATLKDLNRFTPMRNSSRAGDAVPKVTAGSGEVAN